MIGRRISTLINKKKNFVNKYEKTQHPHQRPVSYIFQIASSSILLLALYFKHYTQTMNFFQHSANKYFTFIDKLSPGIDFGSLD